MLKEKEEQVYREIYASVNERCLETGHTFPYAENTYLNDLKTKPGVIDVSRFLQLPNSEFFQAVYVAAVRKAPDPDVAEAWREKEGLPGEEFQQQVLRFVEHLNVVAINHVQFVNNPYFRQNRGLRYRVLGLVYRLTNKPSLRILGRKLPGPIQKLLTKRLF